MAEAAGGGGASQVYLNLNDVNNIIISAKGGSGGDGAYRGTFAVGGAGAGGLSSDNGKGYSGSSYHGGLEGGTNVNLGTIITQQNQICTGDGSVIVKYCEN